MTEKISPFKATKQQKFKGKIYGFDIETYNKNKSFLMATIFGDKEQWVFRDKDKLINFLKTKRFKNSVIVATNLNFDFFGTFFNKSDMKFFNLLFRGGGLIYAKTYLRNKKFNKNSKDYDENGNQKGKTGGRLVFLDTMNYSFMSVKKCGELIGIPKLKSPDYIGKRKPKNKAEWDYMTKYNMRDSEISKKYLEYLYQSFEQIGATPKLTIASTSMSLFKNKYLKDVYFRLNEPDLLEHFEAYYGGRTETFARGKIEGYNYYDINSLYPSVMINEFPNPNTHRVTYKNSLQYIRNFEGISKVDIYCPDMAIPLLPFRTKEKLLFPCGKFTGWYSHVELRHALKLGYKILHVHKSHYYKETCSPFSEFVNDLYNKRKKYKAEGSSMEYVYKILLNSFYGKLAQKFTDKDNWTPFNHTPAELEKIQDFEIIGDYIRIKNSRVKPTNFCFPIWALYVTAYGRIKLHDYMLKTNPVYVDTDSLITKEILSESKELGGLKLEMYIKRGIIIKPKMYALQDYNNKSYVKIKGVSQRFDFDEFGKFIQNPIARYKKFMSFKESVRRNFIPNEIQNIKKDLTLNDTKRVWLGDFNPNIFQESESQKISEVENYDKNTKEISQSNTRGEELRV